MENYTEKILSMYSNINFSQEIRELFDDIQTINIMIINLQNNRYIDEERLEEIENKYQNEISMLANLEKIYNHRNPIDKRNYTLSEYLYSLRYTLIRVGCLKLLDNELDDNIKRKLVGNDKVIYELVKSIIKINKKA